MRFVLTCGLVIAVSMIADEIRADGLLYQLPEDGSWVRFDHVASTVSDKKRTWNRFLTISSVGRLTVDGEKCRWIEFKLEDKQKEGKNSDAALILKVLIPEKHLRKGARPADHVVKAWGTLYDDKNPVELTLVFKEEKYFDPLFLWLAEPLKNVKKLEKEVIEVKKLGKVECDGLTGHLSIKRDRIEQKYTYRTRLHNKAPFGVVSCRIEKQHKRNGEVILHGTEIIKLIDFGVNAKSALPDNN